MHRSFSAFVPTTPGHPALLSGCSLQGTLGVKTNHHCKSYQPLLHLESSLELTSRCNGPFVLGEALGGSFSDANTKPRPWETGSECGCF